MVVVEVRQRTLDRGSQLDEEDDEEEEERRRRGGEDERRRSRQLT